MLIGVSRYCTMDTGTEEWTRDGKLTGKIGWAKFIEWKYPVEVVVTSKASFKAAGAVEAAASL